MQPPEPSISTPNHIPISVPKQTHINRHFSHQRHPIQPHSITQTYQLERPNAPTSAPILGRTLGKCQAHHTCIQMKNNHCHKRDQKCTVDISGGVWVSLFNRLMSLFESKKDDKLIVHSTPLAKLDISEDHRFEKVYLWGIPDWNKPIQRHKNLIQTTHKTLYLKVWLSYSESNYKKMGDVTNLQIARTDDHENWKLFLTLPWSA